jgi:hypothetical protein
VGSFSCARTAQCIHVSHLGHQLDGHRVHNAGGAAHGGRLLPGAVDRAAGSWNGLCACGPWRLDERRGVVQFLHLFWSHTILVMVYKVVLSGTVAKVSSGQQ